MQYNIGERKRRGREKEKLIGSLLLPERRDEDDDVKVFLREKEEGEKREKSAISLAAVRESKERRKIRERPSKNQMKRRMIPPSFFFQPSLRLSN